MSQFDQLYYCYSIIYTAQEAVSEKKIMDKKRILKNQIRAEKRGLYTRLRKKRNGYLMAKGKKIKVTYKKAPVNQWQRLKNSLGYLFWTFVKFLLVCVGWIYAKTIYKINYAKEKNGTAN